MSFANNNDWSNVDNSGKAQCHVLLSYHSWKPVTNGTTDRSCKLNDAAMLQPKCLLVLPILRNTPTSCHCMSSGVEPQCKLEHSACLPGSATLTCNTKLSTNSVVYYVYYGNSTLSFARWSWWEMLWMSINGINCLAEDTAVTVPASWGDWAQATRLASGIAISHLEALCHNMMWGTGFLPPSKLSSWLVSADPMWLMIGWCCTLLQIARFDCQQCSALLPLMSKDLAWPSYTLDDAQSWPSPQLDRAASLLLVAASTVQ